MYAMTLSWENGPRFHAKSGNTPPPSPFVYRTFRGYYTNILENPLGRIKIQLNNELLPRTCENFRQLCTGEYRENGKPLGYKGCKFHRVIKDFMIQGGDFVRGNGQGSFSIYGEMFNDEGFPLDHKKYSVSMANSGPNTNGCQFFICTDNTPHLDGKHVVFGKVIEGFETVDVINRVRVKGDTPVEPIIVTNCGEY